jgi:hypothetical protein
MSPAHDDKVRFFVNCDLPNALWNRAIQNANSSVVAELPAVGSQSQFERSLS